jgi:ribokinase
MNGLDVVSFGALNVDQLYLVNKIAKEDDESHIFNLKESFGGSASNTIIGLSRLGLKTGFIGKVAKDSAGMFLLKNLENEGVDTAGVTVSEVGRSGKVLGFVDKEGQRALYVDPGVNDLIKIYEIPRNYLSTLKVLHLSSFVGGSKKAQEKFLNEIPDDLIISLDPGRIYAERGLDYLKNILKHTNILLLNQKELKLLTLKENKTLQDQTKILLDLVDIVVVKLGENGCYVTDGKESHLVKSFKTKCVDSTGAGDAFNAGFLYGFIKHKSLKKSCKIGNLVASCCIEKLGAIDGLPDTSKLIYKMKSLNKV